MTNGAEQKITLDSQINIYHWTLLPHVFLREIFDTFVGLNTYINLFGVTHI